MTTPSTKRREKERLLAFSFCRADILIELDDNRNIDYVAGACEAVVGRSANDIKGLNIAKIVHRDDKLLTHEILDKANGHGRLEDVTLHFEGKNLAKIPVVLSGYRVPDFDNHFFLACKVQTRKKDYGHLEELEQDQETQLLDVKSFAQSAAQRVSSFIHAGGEAQVSMVKLNHLDDLLEKIGASDKQRLLKSIGNVFKENSIGGDSASRIDENSFSFVHADGVDPEDINQKIEAMAAEIHEDGKQVQAISNTLDVDGAGMSEDQVARALIYTMQTYCENPASLKETSISETLDTLMTNTVENVAYVKSIIECRDLDINYMPIIHLKENYVHHFEGLLRFKGERGVESPFRYVRLAEETGIIADLDMAIIKTSIDQINRFKRQHFIPPIAINLSGLSLSNEMFMGQLNMILRNSPDIAGQLMFEITESAKIDDLPKVNNLLQSIRKLGFEICLDDFGAGAASFDYINALDVDAVKFDGPVVKRAYRTEKGCDLLRGMSDMCHGLNIQTVAEMVEDAKMANHMRDIGIDFGQGWHFGKATDDPLQYKNHFKL